jgi:3-oxoadipate enol-lactonase
VPTIQANGCDFYYELEGEGPDLVFIHGEIHGLEYWEHQIPDFARDHRCFAYNRRGHAKTGSTSYGFSLVNQTRDLAHLIDHFGMKRPVLIAVAFGTTIAGVRRANDPYPDQPEVLAGMKNFREAPSIPGAGRFVHWERPREFNAAVREFVRTLA